MKKKIALVTGGYSGEAVISYKSAEAIYGNIDKEKFDCYVIDIATDGWWYKKTETEKLPVDKNDFSIPVDGGKLTFDAVLISLHGTPGEDGKLQGYFDCLHIPYSSCDAATSAITFNKRFTVAVASFAGINVSKSVQITEGETIDFDHIYSKLKLPFFVKPNSGGSSLGMSKVKEESELEAAIKKAFQEDNSVLIEEFIEGREFTIGVIKSQGKIIPLPITEIVSKNEFFDFEAKYLGASDEITPADISEEKAAEIVAAAEKAYDVFNCRGLVRVDFIYDKYKNAPVMLEINTVPGQSLASLVPQQVVAKGWNLKDFYTLLINECF